jgi:hypothetical protein
MEDERFAKKGRLEEHRKQLRELQVQIDGLAKNIIGHFDPLDFSMDYVYKIDPTILNVYVKDLNSKHKQFVKIKAEIEQLKGLLGEND